LDDLRFLDYRLRSLDSLGFLDDWLRSLDRLGFLDDWLRSLDRGLRNDWLGNLSYGRLGEHRARSALGAVALVLAILDGHWRLEGDQSQQVLGQSVIFWIIFSRALDLSYFVAVRALLVRLHRIRIV
jgi:hypothetical protein